jgi:hypothetical protein
MKRVPFNSCRVQLFHDRVCAKVHNYFSYMYTTFPVPLLFVFIFSRLKGDNKLFVFLHASAGLFTSFCQFSTSGFLFYYNAVCRYFSTLPQISRLSWAHAILTQWQKRAKSTPLQLCTILSDTVSGMIRRKVWSLVHVSRCTHIPAQAVTLSAIWCDGQFQIASNNPITSFRFSAWSFSHTMRCCLNVTLRMASRWPWYLQMAGSRGSFLKPLPPRHNQSTWRVGATLSSDDTN